VPRIQLLLLLAACSASPRRDRAPDDAPAPRPDSAVVIPPDAPAVIAPLEVQFLGVQGFALRHGDDVVLTAPLFTRQSTVEVGLNFPMTSDTAAIDAGMAGVPLDKIRAIVSGHAHFDHLLDVPHVLALAPNAIAYSNLTGRHIFAALAPDRPATCTTAAASPTLPRERLIATDDPIASSVDYTNCPDQRPEGAPVEGSWIAVPGSHVRLMPFCSMHPAQVGPFHFGLGSIDTDQCDLPAPASGWLEGQTLAFIIDFLDDAGHPTFRVFYQDAPTNAPIGFVTPAVLAEKPVDLALLCTGSYDAVTDEPTDTIGNLAPRVALSGHWEDFFQASSLPPQPLPFLDVTTYDQRAAAAMPGPPDAPFTVDGAVMASRHVRVMPNMHVTIAPRP
jgi:hypothetical protein